MTEYVWAFDEGTVKRWVLDGHGGVVIGIQWYSGMFKPDSLGFLSMTGTIEGGHCLWLRGYNEPRDAYRLQNSWGLGWGQLGQAWLRARDLNVLLAAGGEACCGIEQRVRLQGG
jgi:C1A family cysteine protease